MLLKLNGDGNKSIFNKNWTVLVVCEATPYIDI